MYIAMLTRADNPPYRPVENLIHELYTELDSTAGGKEMSAVNVMGETGNMIASLTLKVECVTGYSGSACKCLSEENCTPGNVYTCSHPCTTFCYVTSTSFTHYQGIPPPLLRRCHHPHHHHHPHQPYHLEV